MIRTDSPNTMQLIKEIENVFRINNVEPTHGWIDNLVFDHFFRDDSLMVHRTDATDIIINSIFSSIEEKNICISDKDACRNKIEELIALLVKEVSSEYDKHAVKKDLSNTTEVTLKDGRIIPINKHLTNKEG